jgi:hypothetical protein
MQKLKRLPFIGACALLAYLPFHIFLSQSLSLLTGGLDIWKIWKDVLLFALVSIAIILVFCQKKAGKSYRGLLLFTLLYGALHLIVWAAHPHIYKESAVLGTVYNLRLPLYLLLGYSAVLLLPKFAFSSVLKLVLIVSTIVAGLGVVQYFLPPDILTHVGYGIDRGARAAFFIDDNPLYPRVFSTLREPNALGAYLILPTAALTLLCFEVKEARKKVLLAGASLLHIVAITLTFSRSAWAGAVLAIVLVIWWHYKVWLLSKSKQYWPLLAALVIILAGGLYLMRDTSFVHQYVVHSDQVRKNNGPDSNGYHTILIQEGLHGIRVEPFGHGPGTAGLVSIHNPDGGQLTENYYIQIGYETGVIGALLFIGLNVWIFIRLWRRKDMYAGILCASFVAYVLTNMLLHTWSNEAVAGQWWILAGMALVTAPETKKKLSASAGKTPPRSA